MLKPLCFMGIFVLTSFCLGQKKPDFESLFFQGYSQMVASNYSRAINFFEKTIQIIPSNPSTHYYLGQCYAAEGYKEQASANFIRAITLNPKEKEFVKEFFNFYGFHGVLSSGVLNLSDVSVQKNLASVFIENEAYVEAITILEKLKKQNLEDKEVLFLLRISNIRMNNKTKKRKTPVENPVPYGRVEETETSLKENIEKHPTNPYYYFLYGQFLYEDKKYIRAKQQLEMGLEFIIDENDIETKMKLLLTQCVQEL